VVAGITSNWIKWETIGLEHNIGTTGVCLRITETFEMMMPTLGTLCKLCLFLDALVFLVDYECFFSGGGYTKRLLLELQMFLLCR
jgi:hypothetical protein